MCTDIKIKDVSRLVIIMCLVDKVVHMVIGLHPVYTLVLNITSLWLVACICYLVYAVLSLHELSGLSRGKQLGIFVFKSRIR
jgi:hypothetical protein